MSKGELGVGTSFPGDAYAVTHVYSDACKSEGALEPVGPTVDDLVQALEDQHATDAVISDVVLDGQPGERIDLVQTAGLDRSECRHATSGPLQIWANPGETGFYAFAPEHTGRVYAVDVGGDRVVLSAVIGPGVPESDIAEFEAMIDSIEFGP